MLKPGVSRICTCWSGLSETPAPMIVKFSLVRARRVGVNEGGLAGFEIAVADDPRFHFGRGHGRFFPDRFSECLPPRPGGDELVDGEAGRTGGRENGCLLPLVESMARGSSSHAGRDQRRRSMLVGVDEVAGGCAGRGSSRGCRWRCMHWAWLGLTQPAISWKPGPQVEVADRAVGEAALDAEALVDGRVDLAHIAPMPGVSSVSSMQAMTGSPPRAGVIGDAERLRFRRRQDVGRGGADRRGAGEAEDRRQRRGTPRRRACA